jgi:flagellar biosynthesis/type III secretory pathway chaperone
MLSEIKIWILIAVAGIMATILGFIIKVVTGQVLKRLDEIVTELKQLTQATTIQGQQIKGLQEQDAMIYRRLNDHSARIRTLERGANKSEP